MILGMKIRHQLFNAVEGLAFTKKRLIAGIRVLKLDFVLANSQISHNRFGTGAINHLGRLSFKGFHLILPGMPSRASRCAP